MGCAVIFSSMAIALAAFPAAAQPALNYARIVDFIEGERGSLIPGNSDFEKHQAARYGLGTPDDDHFTYRASDEIRVRWRLTKIKMRVPLNTSGLE